MTPVRSRRLTNHWAIDVARECLGLIDRLPRMIGRDREAKLVSSTWRSRTLSCHAMCSSKPALSARSTDSRDAVTLTAKMARLPRLGGVPRARRELELQCGLTPVEFLALRIDVFHVKNILEQHTRHVANTSPNFPLERLVGNRLIVSATSASKSECRRTKIESRDCQRRVAPNSKSVQSAFLNIYIYKSLS